MAPPLHEAVMKSDAARVRALLDSGEAVDGTNDVRRAATPAKRAAAAPARGARRRGPAGCMRRITRSAAFGFGI